MHYLLANRLCAAISHHQPSISKVFLLFRILFIHPVGNELDTAYHDIQVTNPPNTGTQNDIPERMPSIYILQHRTVRIFDSDIRHRSFLDSLLLDFVGTMFDLRVGLNYLCFTYGLGMLP